jgi:hypothetical protein
VTQGRHGRQFAQHLILGATQQKRLNQPLQGLALLALGVALDGPQVAQLKVLPRAQ